MTRLLGLHVDGRPVQAADGAVVPVHSPWDGSLLFECAHAGQPDVDAAVGAARRAFDDGRWWGMDVRERARILNRVAGLIADEVDALAESETEQTGRPLREMRAQLRRLPEWFEYFGALAQTEDGRVPQFGNSWINLVRRRPLGVAALVTPWNHPLLITVKKLSVALAAGNSVVVKPSELAPAGPLRLAELIEQAGVPTGVVNVVTGLGATTGAALVGHASVDRIDVTGGTPTGRDIAALAGRRLVPVTAELGGKAPVIVFGDSGVDRSVAGALFASFVATGQTCVQGARVLVQDAIADEFVDRLVARTRELRLGDPREVDTQVGPLISEAQRNRVSDAVERARLQGARVTCGGQVPEGHAGGWFYEPTVICDVTPSMDIWTEEVFGPVTVVRSFRTEDEAVERANDSPFGLAGSIWTADVARALRVADRLDVGIVWINDHHRVDPASPWGGSKDSGLGTENGREAFLGYTQPRSVILSTAESQPDWFGSDAEVRYS